MKKFCRLMALFLSASLLFASGCVSTLNNAPAGIPGSSSAGAANTASVSDTRIMLDTVCTITVYCSGDSNASVSTSANAGNAVNGAASTGANDADIDATDGNAGASAGANASAKTTAAGLLEEAFKLCASYEAMFSTGMESSYVCMINRSRGEPVTVPPQVIEVISKGLVFGELSGGMFDVTIGRLTSLWDFKGNASVPSDVDLKTARETVDYTKVTVDADDNTIQLKNPETWLDFGGIAKGYIADRIAAFLMENGASAAVVDLGGDVVVAGSKPDGSVWHIGIRKPFGGQSELMGAIETTGAAIVTSGIYERQFEENGVLYHHILDPSTGMPVRSDVVSATVVAENAMAGDALSTVILLVGSARAAELTGQVQEFIGALLVTDGGGLIELGETGFSKLGE